MCDDTIKKNISKNISKYREKANISQKELAKQLGVVPSRISNWETGANCPTIDMLFKVCEILNVSINDIYGVYPDAKFVLKYEEQEIIKQYRSLDQIGKEHINTVLQWETDRVKQIKKHAIPDIDKQQYRIIQYYQRIASAGTGQVIFEDMPIDRIEIPDIPEYKRVSYAIGVNGNSMEPLYYDGDMLLVEPTCQVEVGEIGIFIVGNEAYVKQLGDNELISLNKNYDNITLTNDSKCMGRVVGKYKV